MASTNAGGARWVERGAHLLVVTALTIAYTSASSAVGDQTRRKFVVWGKLSLPKKVERVLDRMEGVRATSVRLGLDWLSSSRAADGSKVDDPADGYSYPMEAAAVDPHEYRKFSTAADGATVGSLARGQTLMSKSTAALRKRDKAATMTVIHGGSPST
jgi:hypothetical protein